MIARGAPFIGASAAFGIGRAAHLACPEADRTGLVRDEAVRMAEEDALACAPIGALGAVELRDLRDALAQPSPFHVLTHCIAGRLATVNHGAALAVLCRRFDDGTPPRAALRPAAATP